MVRRLSGTLTLALGLAAATATPAAACRCAQLPLDRYFEAAEIVLVGEVLEVVPTTVEETEVLAIEARPLFRQGRPFKGELAGVALVTPVSSARCGVPVEVGETYLIFASRVEAGDPEAWFDSCGGSRLYAGGARAEETTPFVGLPRNRVVPRLFELADPDRAAPTPPSPHDRYHTSPACWTEPRTFHPGSSPEELRDRIVITRVRTGAPPAEPAVSPNGAYRAWIVGPDTSLHSPWQAEVLVDVERPDLLRIALAGVAWKPEARWVNEKLLFLRVPFGRLVASDLLLDVERGLPVYEEQALDGELAFEQFREQCAGQCPCAPVPGSLASAPEPPLATPGPGEPSPAEARRLIGRLAYLDGDWDGRVYGEAGGTTSVLSALKGTRPREEYPAEILESREAAGGLWFHVRLHAGNPCDDPHTPIVHAGWVPAYSAGGALVAGSYPGGC